MAHLVFYVSVCIFLMLALLKLLLQSPRRSDHQSQTLTINDFLPVHHHAFEEVDLRLSEYEEMLKKIQTERREFALTYLNAIRDDFERVIKLLNRAAKFLPELTLEGESERLTVRLKFRLQWRLAYTQILFGHVPAARLRALTSKVGLLAQRADYALNTIAREHGLGVLQLDLNR
jgi:hypothetical protein